MRKVITADADRLLFRLDFALRGHAAYTEPASLEVLIERVEATGLRLGAPLLRYIERHETHSSTQLNAKPKARRSEATITPSPI